MAQRGRAWQPTPKDRELVKAMTAYGISQNEICAVLKITKPTLEKRCREELDTEAGEANAKVAESMFKMATRGPHATRFQAARYWLAARGGRRDGDRTTVIQIPMASYEMSTEQLDELLKREEAHRREREAAGDGAVVQFPKPPRRRR